MVVEWPLTTLDDEVELLTGFPFKSDRYTDAVDGIRLLRGDNIIQGSLRWDGVKKWPAADVVGYENYQLQYRDVVLAMDRPWIEAGLKYAAIFNADLPCLLVQRTARLRGGARLDTEFLRYIIGSREFTQHILAVQTGTVVPHISAKQIKEFSFFLPPLPKQKAIASVLGTLDDLIEVNREINETLEEMARALFKSWFVDFDPVRAKLEGRPPAGMDAATAALFPDHFQDSELGQIPKGWDVKPLSKNIELLSGGTPKTSEPSYWDGEIPWYSVRDAPSDTDVWVVDTDRKITPLGVSDSATSILPKKTTIISARGTVGKLALIGRPMAMNQSCYGVRGAEGYREFFTFYALKEGVEELQQNAHGSVFDTITRETFSTLNVASPPITVADAFEALVEPLLETILANVNESRDLATLRDTLLPKLLSGVVSVERGENALPKSCHEQ